MNIKSILGLMISTVIALPAYPCTRVLWENKKSDVIVGRNMDWAEDTMSNMWLFPKGIERDGLTKENPLKWTSKYGSVIITVYDIGTADGLNEKGLTVNLLYLTESQFPARDPKIPGLAVSLWSQYYLDNFATVAEAVSHTEKHPFQVQTAGIQTAAGRREGTVHIAISDKTGDSAVLEYINGKVKIYHDKNFKVMTNSPPFDQQIAALSKYKGFGGAQKLPGTTDAADRFVRAAYYNNALPDPKDYREAVAGVLSVLRNVSQPFGTPDPVRPYISTTRWRTVADLTKGIYFYENVLSPNIVWVDFAKLNFAKGQPVQKIGLIKNYELIGDVSTKFAPVKPFQFLKPETEPARNAQL